MLTIRLQRVGRRKRPHYRVIINEKGRDTYAPSLEILGHFDPFNRAESLVLKKERITYWLSMGAQTSAAVHNLLVDQGVVNKNKKSASGKYQPKASTEEEATEKETSEEETSEK